MIDDTCALFCGEAVAAAAVDGGGQSRRNSPPALFRCSSSLTSLPRINDSRSILLQTYALLLMAVGSTLLYGTSPMHERLVHTTANDVDVVTHIFFSDPQPFFATNGVHPTTTAHVQQPPLYDALCLCNYDNL